MLLKYFQQNALPSGIGSFLFLSVNFIHEPESRSKNAIVLVRNIFPESRRDGMFIDLFQIIASSSVGAKDYSADCSIIAYFAPTELFVVLANLEL